jgi:hypothetical protein
MDKLLETMPARQRPYAGQSIYNHVVNLIRHFEGDHMQDAAKRDACLDEVIEMIRAQKSDAGAAA